MISFRQLPESVREVLSVDDSEINRNIVDKFHLTDSQFDGFIDAYLDIVGKIIPTTSLPQTLEKKLNISAVAARTLALEIALQKLWQFQEYLGDVDALIEQLGGTPPPPIPLPVITPPPSEQTAPQSQVTPADDATLDWVQGTARELMQEGKVFTDLYLTQKPLKDLDDRLKSPSVSNWLTDYLETMGAGSASSLKRSQYLARSRNASKLNDAEKENLLNFLLSYEEDMPMYWEVAEDAFIVAHRDLPSETLMEIERTESVSRVPELWDYYKSVQNTYDVQFMQKAAALETETADNPRRLIDIAWDALGMTDADRCLTAVYALIQKGLFNDTFKNDQRFKGILARALDAHYGTAAKNTWNGELSGSVIMGIFWKLLLVEKLGIEEGTASILADYFSRKLTERVSPLYLDLKEGKFKFREIVYKDRSLQFAQ